MNILKQLSLLNRILILGSAREGQSAYKFLKKMFPKLNIAFADIKDGSNYLNHLQDYRLVIKSSGISPHLPQIVAAKSKGIIFTSITNIFFESCKGKIIGITGTKGKSTTASLVYHVLKENGMDAVLVGNIGKPSLDYLSRISPDTYVIHELSSFQLIDITRSPHIAVLLPIFPDHMDYHKDLAEYKSAKFNITKYQTSDDYLICHQSHKDVKTSARKIVFSVSDFDPMIKTQLLGEHNKLNIIPSLLVGKIMNIPKDKIYTSISTFQPLETRLTNCGTFNEITFYADTLATIPEATIAAIDTLNPTTLIAGGFERQQNYAQLGLRIDTSSIQTLILFPTTGSRIAETVTNPRVHIYNVGSMKEAVEIAFKHTLKNTVCLLSPGAPSFSLFKDYHDEFEQYQKYIHELSANQTLT